MGDDAVIAGEHRDQRRVDMGRAALPTGEPYGDVLQPAERTGGLGQLGLPRPRRVDRGGVGFRHGFDERAKIVKRARLRVHPHSPGAASA